MDGHIYPPPLGKKVNSILQEKGFESYCPLNKVRRKWSDRIKVVEEPLFKSYVFVKISDKERSAVRLINGTLNFVYWDGKPAVIKEREIVTIKRFLDEYENVEARPMEIKLNQRVRITNGTLMDQEGKVIDIRHKKVKVEIDSLGYILVAYIERSKLSSVKAINTKLYQTAIHQNSNNETHNHSGTIHFNVYFFLQNY
jgi:transcription antitermination factor NusG